MIEVKRIPIPGHIPEILEAIYLNGHLKPDPSNYAPGRLRGWFPMEWNLQTKQFMESSIQSHLLWSWCQRIWPEAEIGLITYSGATNTEPKGIKLHRDDSYGDFKAVGINVTGECRFTYLQSYRSYEWDPQRDPEVERVINLKPGDVYTFNCKNRHSAEPSPNRFAINLWHISKKTRHKFEEYTNRRST